MQCNASLHCVSDCMVSVMGGKLSFAGYAHSMVRLAALLLVVVLWPPLVGFAYLSLRPEDPPLLLEYAALGVIVLPGAIALWCLCPFKWPGKAAFTAPYVLVMVWMLFVMALGTVCARFGNCS